MAENSGKAKETALMRRCIKAPSRVLVKARSLYMQCMSDCAGRLTHGGSMGPQFSPLPESFGFSSSSMSGDSDDVGELVRAAFITRNLGSGKLDLEHVRRQPTTVPLGRSVGMGKIDEDEPCEFDEHVVTKTSRMYPRSRSQYGRTVSGRAKMF